MFSLWLYNHNCQEKLFEREINLTFEPTKNFLKCHFSLFRDKMAFFSESGSYEEVLTTISANSLGGLDISIHHANASWCHLLCGLTFIRGCSEPLG